MADIALYAVEQFQAGTPFQEGVSRVRLDETGLGFGRGLPAEKDSERDD
jgi:hypothetical protein